MNPDKRLHRILVGRRRPKMAEEVAARAFSAAVASILEVDQSSTGAVQQAGPSRGENRDDAARSRIRAGGFYVHGDSPRGRRMRELSQKLSRGEINGAEYSRLSREALQLSPT